MTLHGLSEAIKRNHRQTGVPLTKRPKAYALFDDIAGRNPDMQAEQLIKRQPYEFEDEYGEQRNLKAELIRRNLVSRHDLMRLYTRPQKLSSLPENNPFLTRTVLTQPFNSVTATRVTTAGAGFQAGIISNPMTAPGG